MVRVTLDDEFSVILPDVAIQAVDGKHWVGARGARLPLFIAFRRPAIGSCLVFVDFLRDLTFGRRRPQSHFGIKTAGCLRVAVRRKREARDPVFMVAKRSCLTTAEGIPQFDGVVPTGCGERFPVRRKCQPLHRVGVSPKFRHETTAAPNERSNANCS